MEEILIDQRLMSNLNCGLYILSTKLQDKDNACIVDSVVQITSMPTRIIVGVNNNNLSHDYIMETKEFNLSVLDVNVPLATFQKFGYVSGKNVNKFSDISNVNRSENGISYFTDNVNTILSAKVVDIMKYETHTMFVAEVTNIEKISDIPSVTYKYYLDEIRINKAPQENKTKKYVCKICGYVHEGEIPKDFTCPICKMGKEFFEEIKD
ncbi:MAG: flavin reductase [Clostridia bacterium]|nr:flavin reductase [Clostridia bacterium]